MCHQKVDFCEIINYIDTAGITLKYYLYVSKYSPKAPKFGFNYTYKCHVAYYVKGNSKRV